jgi:hypothetical protein
MAMHGVVTTNAPWSIAPWIIYVEALRIWVDWDGDFAMLDLDAPSLPPWPHPRTSPPPPLPPKPLPPPAAPKGKGFPPGGPPTFPPTRRRVAVPIILEWEAAPAFCESLPYVPLCST